MPDPFSLVAFFESSNGTNLQNSSSSASGNFGIINSTWRSALSAIGGDPSKYPTAISAPNSVQFAVEAQLLRTHGFGDYTCAGCDAALTAQLAATGGPAAYNLGNLSTNPADYSSVDTAAGLQTYFQSNGASTVTSTGPGGDTLTFPTLSTPGSSVVSVTTGASFNPFTWIWNTYQTGVQSTLSGMIGTIEGQASGPIGSLLVLDVAILGVLLIYHISSFANFSSKLFRAGVVVAALGSTNLFQIWIVDPFTSFPNWIGAGLGLPAKGAAAFDAVFQIYLIKANEPLLAMPWYTGGWWESMLWIYLGAAFLIVGDGIMFFVWFFSQVGTQLLFLLGPILTLALLFDYTRHLFDRYIGALVHLALTAFVSVVLADLLLNLMIAGLNSVKSSKDSIEATSALGIGIGVFVLSFSVPIMAYLISHVTGGFGAANRIAQMLGGAAAEQAPARAAGAAVGAAAAAPIAIARGIAPAGSSLSRSFP